jgi:hypothetical protein
MLPSNISAAMAMVSERVGCGWTVRPISSASAPISMASAASAIRSPALGPTMPQPRTRLVASSNKSLVMPSSRPSESERAEAAQGKIPLPYLIPLALASFSVMPTQATSGSVLATLGITLVSKKLLRPAAVSAATLPSCTALWASIGRPTVSPIAKISGTLARCCLSTGMKPCSSTRTPAFSTPIRRPFGRRPTATSIWSNVSEAGALPPSNEATRPSGVASPSST